MKESFGIEKGEIIFDENHVEILDDMRPWHRYQAFITGGLGFILAVIFLLRYFREGESWYLIVFALMLAMGIPGSFISYRMCYDRQVKYCDIMVVRIQDNFAGQLVADIILKNRRKRQVILDRDRLSQFERTRLDHFTRVLKSKGISIEFK